MKHMVTMLLAGCIITNALCMENNNNALQNQIEEYTITPDNLMKLIPKLPRSMKIDLDTWTHTGDLSNQQLLKELTETPPCDNYSEVVSALRTSHNFYYGCYKLPNLSQHNYVFKIGENTIVKISGLISRLCTLYKLTTGKDPYYDTEKKQAVDFKSLPFKEMTASNTPTFQHVSAVAHYLHLQKAILSKSMHHIKTTPTYLYHILKTPPVCADSNFVTVQEEIPSYIKELRTLPDYEQEVILNALSNQTLEELHYAIKAAALWDIRNNIMVNTNNTQELWVTDLEQPNNSGQFFYAGNAGREKYRHDYMVGQTEFGELLKKYAPDKFEAWQSFKN